MSPLAVLSTRSLRERAALPDEVLEQTLEVFQQGVAAGLRQRKIAEQLGIGLTTLQSRVARLRELGVGGVEPREATPELRRQGSKEAVERNPTHYRHQLPQQGHEAMTRMLANPVDGEPLRAVWRKGAGKTHDKWSELTEQVAAGHVKRLATLDARRPRWRQDWVDDPARAVGIFEAYLVLPEGNPELRTRAEDGRDLIPAADIAQWRVGFAARA